MNIVEFITKLFGNKAQKDMREIQPYVDLVKAVYPEIDALSNDQLRARSQALMDKIAASVAPQKAKMAELRASIEELEIDKREKNAPKRYEKSAKERKPIERERKVDRVKGWLIANTKELMETLGATDLEVKTETELSFVYEGNNYTFKLTKHRAPKA